MSGERSIAHRDYFVAETRSANALLYAQIVRGVARRAFRELAARMKTGQPPDNILLRFALRGDQKS